MAIYEKQRALKEAELAPIRLFDDIISSISNYLDYRKRGFIKQNPEGLKITEDPQTIKVENIFQGRILCTITFPKKQQNENLRIFEIQTLSKKGTLLPPQTIGLYTSEYNNLKDIPKRPDEKQANALLAIEKKISSTLKILNDDAQRKENEQLNIFGLKRINNNKRRY